MTLFGPDTSTARDTGDSSRPRWVGVTSGRCDQCVVTAVRDPTHRIAPARWRRIAHGNDGRYCYEHARPIREHDERQTGP